MDDSRTLVFALACDVGFDTAKVKAALMTMVRLGKDAAYGSGGKVLQSSSVGGESFNFSVPTGFDPTALIELCRTAYGIITEYTDAELETYALQKVAGGIQVDFRTLQGV